VPDENAARTLHTSRLTLRPFVPGDALEVARLLDDGRVASTVLELPRPYGVDDAVDWIRSREPARVRSGWHTLAVCPDDGSSIVGAVSLRRSAPDARLGTLGYWIGTAHQGRGHATEAACALVSFGFETLGLDRIEARHLVRNPASGRVLEKAGLTREATLAGYLRDPHTGVLEDFVQWATLRDGTRRIVPGGLGPGARIATIALLVHDYDVARDWFVERLGFRLVEDALMDETNKDGSSKRWVILAPAGGGTHLLIARASSGRERAVVGRQGGGRVWGFLETDDFARDHERFAAAGVDFVERPRHEPYGTVAVFRDVCGNRWDLIEPAREPPTRRQRPRTC